MAQTWIKIDVVFMCIITCIVYILAYKVYYSHILTYGNIHNIVCQLHQPIPFTNGNSVSHIVVLRMCCTSSPVESLLVYTHYTLRIVLLTFGNKTLADVHVFPCPYNQEIADYNIYNRYLKSLLLYRIRGTFGVDFNLAVWLPSFFNVCQHYLQYVYYEVS